jgi:hypothetical protein
MTVSELAGLFNKAASVLGKLKVGSFAFFVKSCCQRPVEKPFTQQIKVRQTIHYALNELQSVHLAFRLAITPGHRKSLVNGRMILS